MAYFQLVTYFLVFIWIQEGVARNQYGSIWSNTSIVSQGDSYTISCKSEHGFLFIKNDSYPRVIANERCGFVPGISKKEYECKHEKRENVYFANLTIKRESYPTTVEWTCSHINDGEFHKSGPLKIEVRRDDSSSSPPSSSLSPPSSPTSKDPLIAPFGSRNNQPPFSTTNNVNQHTIYFNIILIAICAVGVLVLFNTVLVLMFLYKRRTRNLAKQDSEPLELRPRGLPAEDTYNKLDRNLDDGHVYATTLAQGIPESSNLNIDGDRFHS